MNITITTIQNNVSALTKYLTELARNEVAVGVPETAPDKDGASQAYIAAIHEFGSPRNNIPKRSFLASTLNENLGKYANILTNEINNTVLKSSIIPSLKKLAIVVQNDVLSKFTNNSWQQNAPSTVKQKGSSAPLIDTGELRQSIRGIVRNKK